MHIIQYNFLFIRQILQYNTNKNYIYVAVRIILITFYHIERMFLENGAQQQFITIC